MKITAVEPKRIPTKVIIEMTDWEACAFCCDVATSNDYAANPLAIMVVWRRKNPAKRRHQIVRLCTWFSDDSVAVWTMKITLRITCLAGPTVHDMADWWVRVPAPIVCRVG